MKKKLIAAGAASLAVAAMPVVGVFANTGKQFTDSLSVNVEKTCVFEATQNNNKVDASGNPLAYQRHFAATVALGQVAYLGGDTNAGSTDEYPITMTVACNDAAAVGDKNTSNETMDQSAATAARWTINAYANEGTANGNTLTSTTPNTTPIESGVRGSNDSGTAEVTNGGTSYWSFRIDTAAVGETSFTNLVNNYGAGTNYYEVPATSTAVVTAAPAAADLTFTPKYRVYVGTNQEPATYTGSVTYVLSDPWYHA